MKFNQIYDSKIEILIAEPAYHKIKHISVCSDDTSNDYLLVQDISFILSWKKTLHLSIDTQHLHGPFTE